jgi:hypothetical protein
MSRHEIIAALSAIPPGVTSRQGTSLTHPVKVPDLIGIRDRKHLDATGLGVHRGPADLMRYAAVNQTMDVLANYGGFIPGADPDGSLPAPGTGFFVGTADRYGDAELHALALYLYSLEPPPNPHPFDDLARRGQDVFTRERCGHCHTPPLYTNNMLVPAPGFDPPAAHRQTYDVMDRRVYTDPTLTLMTRAAPATTKCRRSRASGTAAPSSTTGRWPRSRTGSTRHDCGRITFLPGWRHPTAPRDPSRDTRSASPCRTRIARRSSRF